MVFHFSNMNETNFLDIFKIGTHFFQVRLYRNSGSK